MHHLHTDEFENILRCSMGADALAEFDRHCEKFETLLGLLEKSRQVPIRYTYYLESRLVRDHLEKVKRSIGNRIPLLGPTIASMEARWNEYLQGLSWRERWALASLDRFFAAKGHCAKQFWYRLYRLAAPGIAL